MLVKHTLKSEHSPLYPTPNLNWCNYATSQLSRWSCSLCAFAGSALAFPLETSHLDEINCYHHINNSGDKWQQFLGHPNTTKVVLAQKRDNHIPRGWK